MKDFKRITENESINLYRTFYWVHLYHYRFSHDKEISSISILFCNYFRIPVYFDSFAFSDGISYPNEEKIRKNGK